MLFLFICNEHKNVPLHTIMVNESIKLSVQKGDNKETADTFFI